MRYRVFVAPAAQREIDRLRGLAQVAIRGVIIRLADEPRPPGAAKVVGLPDVWRLRLRIDGHPWRIVYRIDDREKSVVIARVARRGEGTYRGL